MPAYIRNLLVALTLISSAAAAAAVDKEKEKQGSLMILGWVEHAYLIGPNFPLKAKLDSGAKTSSLDARIIKAFRQYDKRWVRFAVEDPKTGEETVLVRERERTIRIVQHEGKSEIRPTVNIDICIAGLKRNIEVSLVDRENFTYPLLMGRRALKHIAVIHPGETYMSDESCVSVKDDQDSSPKPTNKESPNEQEDTEQSVDAMESSGENEASGSDEERSESH